MIRRGQYTSVLRAAKWIGTAAGVAGATLIALNLGTVVYGFALFLVSSLLWCAVGFAQLARASCNDDTAGLIRETPLSRISRREFAGLLPARVACAAWHRS